MRFSPLFYSNPTINTWQNKAFTMPTDLAFILFGQMYSRSHCYFSSDVNVALCQTRVFIKGFSRQIEKCLNTLPCYLLCRSIHSWQFSPSKNIHGFHQISLFYKICKNTYLKLLDTKPIATEPCFTKNSSNDLQDVKQINTIWIVQDTLRNSCDRTKTFLFI